MSFAVGIDLGTSTSEICIYRDQDAQVIPDPSNPSRSPIVPSIVAINPKGELLVGHPARAYVDVPECGVREAKRMMGSGDKIQLRDRSCRPEEIGALILKKLKDNAEEAMGAAIRDVVISVPANFPDAARKATLDAGEIAGLNVIRLINEPTAAALAYGVNRAEGDEQVVVFDFGGGTLDITALEMCDGLMEARSSFGDTKLGGKDFDQVMIDLLLRKFQDQAPNATHSERSFRMLKGYAEEAKIALSGQRSTMIYVPSFAVQGGSPVDLEVSIDREEFEKAASSLLDRARECVRKALAAKEIRPSSIDKVLMVGGTTYIPCVRQLVAEMFNRETRSDSVNPDLAVAMGAAIQAGIAARLTGPDGPILIEVSPFGLGIDVRDRESMRLMYSPLIPPNTTIPFSIRKEYRLMRADQNEVEIELFQDHSGTANFIEEAIETGIKGTITDIPPSVEGVPHTLDVFFSYDLSGMAQIEVLIPATGQKTSLKFDKTATRSSTEELEESKKGVADLWTKNPNAARYGGLIRRAEQFTASNPAARDQIEPLVKKLLDALVREDHAVIAEGSDALTDLLYDLEAA
jgi:molecular chaperone DnaK